MKSFFITLFCILLFFVVFSNCEYDKLPLPVEKSDVTAFGANDTAYIEIRPVWSNTTLGIGLDQPSDIVSGPDGYLWVANSGNGKVLVLKKSGELVRENNFDTITPLPGIQALCLDSKLNLIMVNGSNTIYVWNEYLNYAKIQAIAFKAVFRRSNGDTVHYSTLDTEILLQNPVDSLTFENYIYSSDDSDIQKALAVRTFYDPSPKQKKYTGVAAGPFGSNEIYVSEAFENRISRFNLIPEAKVRLGNHRVFFVFKGQFDRNVVTYGTGAGTVDSPRGLIVDNLGNLYLTQWGANFLVQKLLAGSYASEYELYKHPIMDLEKYVQPNDITLDDQENIFVVDSQLKKVFKFDNVPPGAGYEISLGNKGLATAEFSDPRGILFADGVIYVTDAGTNEIRRFKLSISDSDLPVEPGDELPKALPVITP